MNAEIDYQRLAELVAGEITKEFLNRDEVCKLLGYGKQSSAFSRLLIQDKTFPRPFELLDSGRKKWYRKDVLAWIEGLRNNRAKMALETS